MRKLFCKFVAAAIAAGAVSVYAASGALLQAEAPQSDSLFTEIGEIIAELSKISGLQQRHRIEYDRIPKDRVKQFLEEQVKEAVKPEEIRAEEAALKKFGFVPRGFDLKKTTVDLLTEQAAAFYDFRKKKLFIIDSSSGEIQHSALVHELAHALADQNFNLDKYIQHGSKDDDGSLARLAVTEGQATWLTSEYLTARTGQSLKDNSVLAHMWARMSEASAGQFPIYEHAPLYLRETLLFPYTQGMLFQHALVEKLDKAAFSEVFRNPPVSTQQILHPEQYFARLKPIRPELPSFADKRKYRGFTQGEVGELDHAILLRQYAGEKESDEVAPAWRGGRFQLLENKRSGTAPDGGKRTVLLYTSEWSGPEQAGKFFSLYQKVLAGKWKAFRVDSRTADTVAGCGDDGFFLLRREGTRVSSIEGMEAPAGSPSAGSATETGVAGLH